MNITTRFPSLEILSTMGILGLGLSAGTSDRRRRGRGNRQGGGLGVRRWCWRGLSGGVLGLMSCWVRRSQDVRFAKTVANSSGSLPPRYGGMRMSGRLRNSPFEAGAGSASFAQCPALSRDSRSGVVLRRAPKLHRAVGGGISYAASISARVPIALCPLPRWCSQRFRFDSRVQYGRVTPLCTMLLPLPRKYTAARGGCTALPAAPVDVGTCAAH